MATIKINKKNFIKQTILYGYFAEQVPDCFHSADLLRSLPSILPLITFITKSSKNNKGEILSSSPAIYSIYKNDFSRRIISITNPVNFLRLVIFISDNWAEIEKKSGSENSHSPITFIHSYFTTDIELLNIENMRDEKKIKSDFLDNIKDRIRIALGYKIRLDLDIANCYNSIYTHSIAWAMCGKKAAKEYYKNKQPFSMKSLYELADKLDIFIRQQKNNETNGIVVGPFTSRIFSEIILAGIDRELTTKGFIFRRYVDDYKFYFRTEAEAQIAIPNIESVLNEFNLSINLSKIEITRFPFDIISPLQKNLNQAYDDEGIFGVLNAASNFYNNGEKGAFKYAIKFIQRKPTQNLDFNLIIPLLINIMLLEPKHGKFVIQFFRTNSKNIDHNLLSEKLNNEIDKMIENNLQQEVTQIMQIIKDLKLDITGKNILKIIQSEDDLSIIIALDIWKNRKKSVVRTKKETRLIGKAIEQLIASLNNEAYSGPKWFLLYEIRMHQLVAKKILPPLSINDVFIEMERSNVSFYNGIK